MLMSKTLVNSPITFKKPINLFDSTNSMSKTFPVKINLHHQENDQTTRTPNLKLIIVDPVNNKKILSQKLDTKSCRQQQDLSTTATTIEILKPNIEEHNWDLHKVYDMKIVDDSDDSFIYDSAGLIAGKQVQMRQKSVSSQNVTSQNRQRLSSNFKSYARRKEDNKYYQSKKEIESQTESSTCTPNSTPESSPVSTLDRGLNKNIKERQKMIKSIKPRDSRKNVTFRPKITDQKGNSGNGTIPLIVTTFAVSDHTSSDILEVTTDASHTTLSETEQEWTYENDEDNEDNVFLTKTIGINAARWRDIVYQKVLPKIRSNFSLQFKRNFRKLKLETQRNKSQKLFFEKQFKMFKNIHKLPDEMAVIIESPAIFQFSSSKYLVASNQKRLYLDILRTGGVRYSVRCCWGTRQRTAFSNINFVQKTGVVDFLPGQRVKRIYVDLLSEHNEEKLGNGNFLDVDSKNSINFVLELTVLDGLLWTLPETAVDYGKNYEATVEIRKVSIADEIMAKFDEVRIDLVGGVFEKK